MRIGTRRNAVTQRGGRRPAGLDPCSPGTPKPAGILPALLGICRTWVGLFITAPAGPWLRIDGRVLRPALLRDPPHAPPASLPAALVNGRPTCAESASRTTRRTTALYARGLSEERAEAPRKARVCTTARRCAYLSRGVRIVREAARTPPTVWCTTQNGRRHDAAGFARSLRAGGPHMNSRGPPNGVRGAGRMPAALWRARPAGV